LVGGERAVGESELSAGGGRNRERILRSGGADTDVAGKVIFSNRIFNIHTPRISNCAYAFKRVYFQTISIGNYTCDIIVMHTNFKSNSLSN
jgi:hypothetical protein